MQRLNLDRPKLPRNRQVHACLQCRTGKLKCDRSKPHCQRCRANNRDCTYVSRIRNGVRSESLNRELDVTLLGDSTEQLPISLQQSDQTIWPDQAGLLKAMEDSRLRYYSSSSWMSALDDPPELRLSDSLSTMSDDCPLTPKTSPVSDFVINLEKGTSIYDFASVNEVNKAVCYFAEYVHFFYPVVDVQDVTSVLHRHSKSHNDIPPEISALVAAMCFGASSTLILSRQVVFSRVEPAFWKDLGHRFLFASGYPLRSNMNNMRAAFLLSASSMAEWHLIPDPTPISVLVRTAQSLGLHRDPISFQFPLREADFRRRLWWSIKALDLSYSLAHALPPLIHPCTSDVQCLDETNLELKWLANLNRINKMFARILEDIYGTRKPSTDVFQQLHRDAVVVSNSLQKSEDSAQDKFVALCTKMCCAKMTYILHQPYLRSVQWPKGSRTRALDSAMEYIKDYAHATTEPALAQYRWILSHWSMFHPVAIVLQDLVQSPHSAESAAMRDLIDSTFAEFSLSFDHNWKRLEHLRQKAWTANDWPIAETWKAEEVDADASLNDWDPLFASFVWDDRSLTLM